MIRAATLIRTFLLLGGIGAAATAAEPAAAQVACASGYYYNPTRGCLMPGASSVLPSELHRSYVAPVPAWHPLPAPEHAYGGFVGSPVSGSFGGVGFGHAGR